MMRTLLVAAMVIAAASLGLGQKNTSDRRLTSDEDALKQLVREWADAVVHFSPGNPSRAGEVYR